MVTVCCVCQRIKHGKEWLHESIPDGKLPSHGYCPDCAAAARVQLALLRLDELRQDVRTEASSSAA